MSNLLNEAIVDAKALRESALKNAESIVMEKYSAEVKEALEQILEQEEEAAPEMDLGMEDPTAGDPAGEMPEMDPAMTPEIPEEPAAADTEDVVASGDVSFAAVDDLSNMDGKNLDALPSSGEDTEITINLGALQEALQEIHDSQEVEINLDDVLSEEDDVKGEEGENKAEAASDQDEAAMKGMEEEKKPDGDGDGVPPWADKDDDDPEVQEESEVPVDALVDAVMEKLSVDMGAELSGWAGRPTSQLKHEQERELAGMQDDDVKEELEDLNKAQEELVSENNGLKEQLGQYKQAIDELKESLQDVNLSNARLLYTNRVLRNTSLNERQKTKIVEAISGAGSVAEARTIFDTLQSTVESTPKRGPQSLSEAIGRTSTSVIRASRKETISSDPFQDRMKRLAGIKS